MLEVIRREDDDFESTFRLLNNVISHLSAANEECSNALKSGNPDRQQQCLARIVRLYNECNDLSLQYLVFLSDRNDPQHGLDEHEKLLQVIQGTEKFFEIFAMDVQEIILQNFLNMEGYRALFLFQMKKYRRALESCETILTADDSRDGIWILKGFLLTEFGNSDEALEAFETAIRLEWHNPDAWIGKGQIYHSSQNFTKALEAFDTALKIDISNRAAIEGKAAVLNELL